MRKIVFIGGHLGYAMERTPLGGGAMVGLQLARHWPRRAGVEVTALGSGPLSPDPAVRYAQVGRPEGAALVERSELEYAAFCRDFERAATAWLLERVERYDPRRTCVVVNDISEGPDLAALASRGYPIVSLWHVDVVDYFNKLYLGNRVAPERLTRLYERVHRRGLSWVVPDLLRLVFEKQRETVARSRLMILPSRMMAQTVERCYAALLNGGAQGRMRVVPWGMWAEECSEESVSRGVSALRAHYQLGPETRVLMTLSRVSPEKGLHLLLKALQRLEKRPEFSRRDVCLFLCGEPAFMQGAAYWRTVQAEAGKLSRVRTFFPGYLAPAEKAMYFRLAQLFVSPSVHESYGLNVVEAMQAGLPVLASDHYGVHDVLAPEYGRIVHYKSPAKAPEALAAALGELLAAPQALAEMGRKAKAAAASMPFSAAADRILDEALALIEEEPAA